MSGLQQHGGGCHCGAVRYTVATDLSQVIECNCSHCKAKGFLLTFVPPEQFELLQGADKLAECRFNTRKIRHLFCQDCGVQPLAEGKGADGASQWAINVRCLDDVDLGALAPMQWDGASH